MTFQTVLALLAVLLVGLALGAAISWKLARSRKDADAATAVAALADARAAAERARAETSDARAEAAQARAELAGQRELVGQGRTELANAQADRAEAHAAISQARAEVAEARAKLAAAVAEKESALAQVAAIEEDQQRMVDQFRLLSAEQLERQNKTADAAAADRQKAVEALVAPLSQQLKDFQQRVNELEKERATMASELREQVRMVALTGEQVRTQAASLATALRKPQVRGQWGELQLKRVVEVSGMLEHCHFVQQGTTTTSAETTIRPDMTIMLGDNKHVHIDSKVPLQAFLDAHESQDDAERERLLGQFSKNVRTHVDQLSAKQYWKSEGGNSPEFVIMFIPAEALAAEALHRMPDLLQYASDKNVIIATPTSLIGLLKTVAYSWRQADLAENAQQVFDVARELHERLAKLGDHVGKLGRSLGAAVKAYNDSVGSLERRVLPSARKLRDLNVSDLEVAAPARIEETARTLSAPELVDDSEPLTGTLELELKRPEPSLEDLVADTHAGQGQPGGQLRRLG